MTKTQPKTASLLIWLLIALVISSCTNNLTEQKANLTTSKPPQNTDTAESPTEQAIVPDTGWLTVDDGLEKRIINIVSQEGALQEYIYIVRVSPANYRFDVGYQPADPLPLSSWLEQTGASLVINGGFFTEDNTATGLVISSSESFGASYEGFGGMFAVESEGPSLRALAVNPYSSDENLTAALQSFPMLVFPGNQPVYSQQGEEEARRSVIGQDSQGRFILLAAGIGRFTLSELSQFLANSDLDLNIAFNLDGGASTGILLGETAEGIPSFTLLPTVILVSQK